MYSIYSENVYNYYFKFYQQTQTKKSINHFNQMILNYILFQEYIYIAKNFNLLKLKINVLYMFDVFFI